VQASNAPFPRTEPHTRGQITSSSCTLSGPSRTS
jgi:hypothetical protein